jgi:hypothetical protein
VDNLSEDERAIVAVVRDFVQRDVRPVARALEHTAAYAGTLIDQMKRLGVFGLRSGAVGRQFRQHPPLRDDHRGARAWLDEPGWRNGWSSGSGQADPCMRYRPAEAAAAAALKFEKSIAHGSWFENFPSTRIPEVDLPAEGKPVISNEVIVQSGPRQIRELTVDGSSGGPYELPDEELLEIWRVDVEEVSEVIERGWTGK